MEIFYKLTVLNMKSTMKTKLISSFLFFVILIALILTSSYASLAISKITGGADKKIENHIRPLNTLKKIPDDTIDLAFIGDSLVMTGIDPTLADKKTGMNSVVLSSPGMTIIEAYHAFHELLKRQNPRVIMFETDVLYYGGNIDRTKELLSDRIDKTFPIFFYHDTWKNFFSKPEKSDVNIKGYTPLTTVYPKAPDMNYMRPSGNALAFSFFNRRIMNKIIAECKEKNIALCLYSSVCPMHYSMERHNALSIYAEQNSLPFIDLNMPDKKVSIDPHTDFSDNGEHLNSSGAGKSTEALLKEMQSLSLS